MSNKAKLTYWKGRGRAEAVRLMLVAAGVEYEEPEYLTKPEQMDRLKGEGKLKFGQFPLLEMDGMKMVQTGAIIRYIARKHGMLGETPAQQYKIDMLAEGARDFMSPMMAWGFGDNDATLKQWKTTIFPRYLTIFENELISKKSYYLTGSKPTMADIMLLEPLLMIQETSPETLEKYPHIKAFFTRLKALPNIKKYLSSPNRYPPNDATYIQQVTAVLRMN